MAKTHPGLLFYAGGFQLLGRTHSRTRRPHHRNTLADCTVDLTPQACCFQFSVADERMAGRGAAWQERAPSERSQSLCVFNTSAPAEPQRHLHMVVRICQAIPHIFQRLQAEVLNWQFQNVHLSPRPRQLQIRHGFHDKHGLPKVMLPKTHETAYRVLQSLA